MIKNEDIKLLAAYLNDEAVETEKVENLAKRLKLIVKQIEAQEEFNNKMSEISEEFEALTK